MNQHQVNTSNMLNTVMKHLDSNMAVWQQIIPIKEKYDELKTTLAELNKKLINQHGKATGGFTKDKHTAMEELTRLVLKMVLRLKAYAKKTGSGTLSQVVDITESDLVRIPDLEVINRSRLVLNAINDNLAALGDYKITETEMNALKSAIETATAKTVERDAVQGERTSITAAISQLFSRAAEEVSDLDVLIEGMVDDDEEDFINGYFSIRRVNDRGRRKRKTEEKKPEEKAA